MPIRRINLSKLLPYIEEGVTLLTPNLRIKDAIISQYIDERKTRVTPTPAVYPVDVFIQHQWKIYARSSTGPCSNLSLLSSQEELLVWDHVLESSLLSESLLNLEETANSIAHSYRMGKQWLEDETFNRELTKNSDIKDVAVFSEWIQLFREYCKQHRVINLVDATRTLIEVISKNGLSTSLKRIALVNFFNPPPLYRNLFEVLPNLEEVFTNTTDNAINSPIDLKKKLAFQSQESEANHCALWIKKILTEKPNAHIGVLAADKSHSRAKLELALKNLLTPKNLFPNDVHEFLFNISGNTKTLLDSGLIYDAFLILNLGSSQHNTTDIMRLLQSPFINLDHAEDIDSEKENCILLARYLKQWKNPIISSRELLYLMKTKSSSDLLATTFVKLRTEIRKANLQRSALRWSTVFNKAIESFGWPGRIESSVEYSQYEEWTKLLDTLDTSTPLKPNYVSAIKKLRLLAKRTFQRNLFNSSLQISYLSLDEAIGLEFDYLWMLGMDDQHWPEPTNPSPFLPYRLQKQYKMPGSHSEIQLKSASKTFEILLRSTTVEAKASYYKHDGEQEFRPSNFLQTFQSESIGNEISRPFSSEVLNQVGSIPIERIFNSDLPLAPEERVQGGAAIISHQASCPFRAFAINRLKLNPEVATETGISKIAKGNACHIALEQLFKEILSRKELHSISEEQLAIHIYNSATKAVNFLTQAHWSLLTPKVQKIEHRRISNLLEKFIEVEKKRLDFEVVAQEKSFSIDLGQLTLRVRIDRIDRLQSGDIALIDYKTGKKTISPKRWNDERPEDMQLPLYYFITENNNLGRISTLVIASINSEKFGYSGITSSDRFSNQLKPLATGADAISAWQELTTNWQKKINLMASEFNRGVCHVTPVNPSSTCTYCGLQSICRIQEIITEEQNSNKEPNL